MEEKFRKGLVLQVDHQCDVVVYNERGQELRIQLDLESGGKLRRKLRFHGDKDAYRIKIEPRVLEEYEKTVLANKLEKERKRLAVLAQRAGIL